MTEAKKRCNMVSKLRKRIAYHEYCVKYYEEKLVHAANDSMVGQIKIVKRLSFPEFCATYGKQDAARVLQVWRSTQGQKIHDTNVLRTQSL